MPIELGADAICPRVAWYQNTKNSQNSGPEYISSIMSVIVAERSSSTVFILEIYSGSEVRKTN
jgi:hypothetical protein